MYQDRIILSAKDILEKDFKFDTRGYRPQEVDKFLDVIIKDVDEYHTIISELKDEKRDLIDDNMKLKQENRRLKSQLEAIKSYPVAETNNSDLLRRLSNLEKIIYGEKE
jgi:DivIVA domain